MEHKILFFSRQNKHVNKDKRHSKIAGEFLFDC